MATVRVIGSLNVDRGWRVVRHPAIGETVLGEVGEPAPGGKGLNQAVAARRMGVAVALVGRVGDDDDGRLLTAVAAAEGIDVSEVRRDPARATGTALVVVDGDGANTVIVDPGANAALAIERGFAVDAGDVVVAQLEVPVGAVRAGFEAARAGGATTILNPSPVGAGLELVPFADVVVVNQAEAAALSGAPGPVAAAEVALDRARALREASGGTATVVVTLGADGVVAAGPEGDVVVPGIAVVAVDTTGAGDCFLGVLAASLADGRPLVRAVDRANRAAARSVATPGTVDAMPRAVDLA